MNASNEIRQQMWELCYDLLPPEESAALIARIKSDPTAARLYAEVRLQADLVGYAAKVEDPSVILTSEGKTPKIPVAAPVAGTKKAAAVAAPRVSPAPERQRVGGGNLRTWNANWLSAAAALLLMTLIGYGYVRPLASARPVAANFVVTEVHAPSTLHAGLTNKISVRTSSLGKERHAAAVDVRLVDRQGHERFRQLVRTSAEGEATIELPGEAIEPGVQLETQVASAAQPLSAELPVQAEIPLTYFMFEKPVVQPGETVRFSMLRLSNFSKEPIATSVGDMVVTNSDGTPLTEPIWDFDAESGVVSGQFQLPARAEGEVLLAVRDQNGQLAAANVDAFAYRWGDATRSRAAGESLELAGQAESTRGRGVRRSFADAGGVPSSGSESQKLGSASPAPFNKLAQADPSAALSEMNEAKDKAQIAGQDAQEQKGEDSLSVPAVNGVGPQGLAFRSLASQQLGDQTFYSAPVEGTQIIQPGKPATMNIPTAANNLLAAVQCRGVTVASVPLDELRNPSAGQVALRTKTADGEPADTSEQAPDREQLLIDLPAEVAGELQLVLLDHSTSPPQVVEQETAYRLPVRQLGVEVSGLKGEYAPGELVEVRVKVADEQQRPSQATLGVRVWNEQLVQNANIEPVLLTGAVHSRTPVLGNSPGRPLLTFQERHLESLPDDASKNGFGIAGKRPQSAPAAAPAEPSAGVAGGAGPSSADASGFARGGYAPSTPRPLAEFEESSESGKRADRYSAAYSVVTSDVAERLSRNVLLASNREKIEAEYQSLLAQSVQTVQARRMFIGRVLVVGGAVALAAFGLLVLLRLPLKAWNGAMMLTAAAASLLIGVLWMDSPTQSRNTVTAVFVEPESEVEERANSTDASETSDFGRFDQPHRDSGVTSESARNPAGGASISSTPPPLAPRVAAPSPGPTAPAATEPAPNASADQPSEALAEGLADKSRPESADQSRLRRNEKPAEEGATRPMQLERNLPRGDTRDEVAEKREAEEKPADKKMALETAGGAARESVVPADATPPPSAARAGAAGLTDQATPSDEKMTRQRAAVRAVVPAAPGTPAPPAALAAPAEDRSGLAPQGTPPSTQSFGAVPMLSATPPAGAASVAPASLHFDGNLKTDEQGFVTLQFRMPEVESEYRLLIDAVGKNRVGSQQALIICRQPANP